MNVVGYKKNCPDCGGEITYKQKRYLDDSLSKNKKCRWCCNVIRGKSSNRKGVLHSQKSKLLISLSHRGKKWLKVRTDKGQMECDSKYHKHLNQKQKDLVRQKKIIDILKPNKFWRFDLETKTVKDILKD